MRFVQRANIREGRNQSEGSSTRTMIQGRRRNEGTVKTGIVRASTGTETTETGRRRRGIGTAMTGTRGRRNGSETDDLSASFPCSVHLYHWQKHVAVFIQLSTTATKLLDRPMAKIADSSSQVDKIKFSVWAAFKRTHSWPHHHKFDFQANASRRKTVLLRAAIHQPFACGLLGGGITGNISPVGGPAVAVSAPVGGHSEDLKRLCGLCIQSGTKLPSARGLPGESGAAF